MEQEKDESREKPENKSEEIIKDKEEKVVVLPKPSEPDFINFSVNPAAPKKYKSKDKNE